MTTKTVDLATGEIHDDGEQVRPFAELLTVLVPVLAGCAPSYA